MAIYALEAGHLAAEIGHTAHFAEEVAGHLEEIARENPLVGDDLRTLSIAINLANAYFKETADNAKAKCPCCSE